MPSAREKDLAGPVCAGAISPAGSFPVRSQTMLL